MKDYNDSTEEEREEALKALGLSISAVFVPFSKSRNAKEKTHSLNWVVTLSRNGKRLIETDYMQGCAHAPSYKAPVCFENGKKDPYLTRLAIASECETGTIARPRYNSIQATAVKIPPPSLLDVCYSLASDAQCGRDSFEDFCSNFGYDPDSRKAEKTWRACADTYSKLGAQLTEQISTITEGY